MGVFMSSSSCFMTSNRPGSGLLGNSEGRLSVLGVLRAGKAGFGDLGASAVGEVVLMVGGGEGFGEVGAMMAVELVDTPPCQSNDARRDQTGNAC